MIPYDRSAYGLNLMLRVHGSPLYRAFIPGICAVLFCVTLRLIDIDRRLAIDDKLGDPYVVGIVVIGITFLIVFRASQGYSRYWEATTAVYQMQSKWLDATVHTACYHMQCDHYDKLKPPSYYDFPHLNAQFLTRDRERIRASHANTGGRQTGVMPRQRAIKRSINSVIHSVQSNNNKKNSTSSSTTTTPPPEPSTTSSSRPSLSKTNNIAKSISKRYLFSTTMAEQSANLFETPESIMMNGEHSASSSCEDLLSTTPRRPGFLTGVPRLDGNWGKLFKDNKATFFDPQTNTIPPDPAGFASIKGGRTPALFLQELAHLSSLMTAVAMATLRNDVDGAESPLDFYQPGDPWPKVDPLGEQFMYASRFAKYRESFNFFVGGGRSPEERTKYNASRPLPVVGGVSDAEIAFLQLARGPYAKTQLCWKWLSEFITREHMAGSLGEVSPAIISRIIQFMADGMMHYNHGRRIMFVPFPFPHAQLSSTFTMVMVPLIPFLMDQYCEDLWLACILSFLSVVILSGINEVSRELENPFRNVPNEVPLVTLMAEYNEALLTMYSGFHPDSYWKEPTASVHSKKEHSSSLIDDHLASVVEDDKDENVDSVDENSKLPPASPKVSINNIVMESAWAPQTTDTTDDHWAASVDGAEVLTAAAVASAKPMESPVVSPPPKSTPAPPQTTVVSEEIVQLRLVLQQQGQVIEQQGQVMAKMLEEQARLNKLMQNMFSPKESTEGAIPRA